MADKKRHPPDEIITKEEAAKRQIVTAIELYFNGGDYMSILCLVSAAYNVVRDLNKKRKLNYEDFEDLIKINFVESAHKRALSLFTKPLSFGKHADRDPEGKLELHYFLVELWLLFTAILYERIAKVKLFETGAYLGWFAAIYPDMMHEGPWKQTASKDLLPMIKQGMTKQKYFEMSRRANRKQSK